MRSVVRRLSYANVTATLALFIALGGGAYAATQLPAGSVGTAQLQSSSVTSPKVRDQSLRAKDFAPGELPAGPAGPAGISGLEVVYAESGAGTGTKEAIADCPSGKKVTGGGGLVTGSSNGTPTNAALTTSTPGQVPNPTSWYAVAEESTPTAASWRVIAYAVCAHVEP